MRQSILTLSDLTPRPLTCVTCVFFARGYNDTIMNETTGHCNADPPVLMHSHTSPEPLSHRPLVHASSYACRHHRQQ